MKKWLARGVFAAIALVAIYLMVATFIASWWIGLLTFVAMPIAAAIIVWAGVNLE